MSGLNRDDIIRARGAKMIVYTSHRELQEAIDKTLLAYGTYQSDRMRNLTFEHLTKLLQIQAAMMQMVITPTVSK